MKHCIDYRNGAMGNTILSHILYSCNKIDIDLTNFFSESGNAHNLKFYNNTNLTAEHLEEYPDINKKCILTIVTTGWGEALRIKLSYEKWMNEYPTLFNYEKFNINPLLFDYNKENLKAWQDFYSKIKDPSWPNCQTPDEIKLLPKKVQEEIYSTYNAPVVEQPTTENQFVELLTNFYYENFLKCKQKKYKCPNKLNLMNYFTGDIQILRDISEKKLDWKWDIKRSNTFFNKMRDVNNDYLIWYHSIKDATHNLIKGNEIYENFQLWEQAIIIAKSCEITNILPRDLIWDDPSCELFQNNVYLSKLKRK